MRMVDLRSDTVTKPTAPMLEAMMAAEVGDDGYSEDPAIRSLEQTTAKILGKEAALFVPSGVMANQLAIHLHCRPGDSIIAEQGTHSFALEAGAAAFLSGVQFDLIPMDAGYSSEAIDLAFRGPGLSFASSRLLIVENTHNMGAGRVLTAPEVARICQKAKSLGLATHCDGARIWNAAVAAGCSEKDLAEGFDTVAVCFSKGLGAPVGSCLVGSTTDMERARKLRKRLGGGMRQAGFLAAAAAYGLYHHRERLVDDHRRAARLLAGLKTFDPSSLEVRFPELGSNIVYFRFKSISAAAVLASLKERGVLMNVLPGGWVRAVTHLHITDEDIDQAMAALQSISQQAY